MLDKSLESLEFRGSQPRTIGIIVVLLLLCIILWSTFVIVPAGSRGVVLWWGSVEKRIMDEGLNFKVPLAETVMKVDVRVQPHPFRDRCIFKRVSNREDDRDDELPYRSGLCQ